MLGDQHIEVGEVELWDVDALEYVLCPSESSSNVFLDMRVAGNNPRVLVYRSRYEGYGATLHVDIQISNGITLF